MNMIGKTIGLSLCVLLSASCWHSRAYCYHRPLSVYKSPWDRNPVGQFSLDVDQDYLKIRFELNEEMMARFDFNYMFPSGNFLFTGICEGGADQENGLPVIEFRNMDFYQTVFPGFYYKGNLYESRKETLALGVGLNELRFPLFGDGWRLLLDKEFVVDFSSKDQKTGQTFLSDDFYWSNWNNNQPLGRFFYYYEGEERPHPSVSEM